MLAEINYRTIDLMLFIVANLANLLTVGIFFSRTLGQDRVETVLGLSFVALAVPAAIGVIANLLGGRVWWTIVLPLPLIAFCIVEFLFDYGLHLNFRETSLLWPYLILYYAALISMIGYSFGIGKPYGFVTLATYFFSLGATGYAFSKGVG